MCLQRLHPPGLSSLAPTLVMHRSRLGRRAFIARSASVALIGLLGTSLQATKTLADDSSSDNFSEIAQSERGTIPFRVKVELSVEGNLHLPKNAIVSKELAIGVPIRSKASFTYDEQSFIGGNQTPGPPSGFIRHFQEAVATTTIHQTQHQLRLRPCPNGIIAVPSGNAEVLFAHDMLLSREELDLLQFPVASSRIDMLLPDFAEKPEETGVYQLDPDLLCSAFQLSQISSSEVTGEIQSRTDEILKMQFKGGLTGKSSQTNTELEMIGNLNFDVRLGTCTWLALGLREQRDISLAEPGFDLAATLTIQKTPLSAARPLPETLPSRLEDIAPNKLFLEQQSQNLHFKLHTDRSWYMITDAPGLCTMRLIEGDQAIAQCDFRSPPRLAPGQIYSVEDFQADISQKLGEQLDSLGEIDVTNGELGNQILRIEALGQAQQIPIRWIFIHFSDGSGRRLTATFTMESGLSERFADADLQTTSSLRFTPLKSDDSGDSGSQKAPKTEAGQFSELKNSQNTDLKLQSGSID